MRQLGLFSTLTGAGSRALVHQIAAACRSGEVGSVEVAFLFVNREVGESPETDASVAALGAEFAFPVVRASAVAFQREERKRARSSSEAGDDAALEAWRDAFYVSYRERLVPTDLDLLLGDMWIWGPVSCAERRGLNLHPALPGGPAGSMWFDVIWDLVDADATESGVMLHRVTPQVDLGPVASFTRYSLRGAALDPLWAALPADAAARHALVQAERAKKRASEHPLFHALRAEGLRREAPLLLATLRAVAEGELSFTADEVLGSSGRVLPGGSDLTGQVEATVPG